MSFGNPSRTFFGANDRAVPKVPDTWWLIATFPQFSARIFGTDNENAAMTKWP